MVLLVLLGAEAALSLLQVRIGAVCVCCPVLKQPHPVTEPALRLSSSTYEGPSAGLQCSSKQRG